MELPCVPLDSGAKLGPAGDYGRDNLSRLDKGLKPRHIVEWPHEDVRIKGAEPQVLSPQEEVSLTALAQSLFREKALAVNAKHDPPPYLQLKVRTRGEGFSSFSDSD